MSELTNSERLAALRIIDANFNRASEGLRVIEDFVRFKLNDGHLSKLLKDYRHDLMLAIQRLDFRELLAARDTQNDAGTIITRPTEAARENLDAVLRANFQRVQQALRTLEEYGKTIEPNMSLEVEEIRYRNYTLEKAVLCTEAARERFADTRLYVLIDGRSSMHEFCKLATNVIAAGVDVLQLRAKELNDRELLWRAQVLRAATRSSSIRTLFIVNDRPDIAALSDADGVHVGQEELAVADVRKIVGPKVLIGVSTHTIEQARQAVLDGADYIGCGPTFPSSTKSFEQFPGLDFLREVAAEISLPAFAIGGITPDNLPQVLATGFKRVAVSGAVTNAVDPATAVQELRRSLVQ